MSKKITQAIIAYAVVKPDDQPPTTAEPSSPPALTETTPRPEALPGATYKIKPPTSDHALYITINDIILNPNTEHEQRRPFEIFINSKNMDHYQWVIALTRVMSAVFRKGGEVAFLVEELRSVFDPQGGHFRRGGKYIPSLVAEIGEVIERHLQEIGLVAIPEIDASQAAMIEQKQAAVAAATTTDQPASAGGYPDYATVCPKCSYKAVVKMDGCETCLNCGWGRCG